MSSETGTRLRRVRLDSNLSQRRLARQSGVANATISQIESGKLNPTVGLLKKILDGIPMSLSDFFADRDEPADKVFYRAAELVEIADGGVSYLQVGANLRQKSIQFLKERYEPGANTGRHTLSHDGEECGIVLRGRLDITVGEESRVLTAGDAYYFRSSLPHAFKNAGREPCELISACTPPSF